MFRFSIPSARIAAALALGLAAAGAAQAQGGARVYDSGKGYYEPSQGFGEPLVRGEYIGAPLTRFPRPSELVPSAWGYGTYGIPTVAGIRRAPIGEPTVYVIDSPAPAARARSGRSAGPQVLSRGRAGRWSQMTAEVTGDRSGAGGARVISMRAPRR